MTIVFVGLDYRTAPVELRECLYLAGDDLRRALVALHGGAVDEVVILSTCNRLEVYASAAHTEQAVDAITGYLAGRVAQLQPHLRQCIEHDVARHLLRVAGGLESLVLGETEIMGQVADALEQAQQAGTSGALLTRLFHTALHAGKRARSETGISQHTLSVSHAAVLMAKQHMPDLTQCNVLVVGAGLMAELALRALNAHDAAHVRVINRTFSRAALLAAQAGVEAVAWDEMATALAEADVVITATSAPGNVVSREMIAARQPGRKLVMVDIGVPRNVDSQVRQVGGVTLHDIDELQSVVDDHRARRESEVWRVEAIIDEEVIAYLHWLESRSAVSTIVALREKAADVAALELERAFHRLPDLSQHERDVIEHMAHRIVNKLLHNPTAALRERAAAGDHFTYLHAVQQLFDLEAEANSE